MSRPPPETCAEDLAPGDRRHVAYDWAGATLHRIRSSDDPLFDRAYRMLHEEFGARGEVERRAVLESRLRWDPARPVAGHALLYEIIFVERGGEPIAVRDHTAILRLSPAARGARPTTVVHLSHALVVAQHRRSGIAAWLRGLPLRAAHECAERAGERSAGSIDLVAEMEPPAAGEPQRTIRLAAYERAGFLAVDPEAVPYRQPDFRDPATIDAQGLRPLPLALILRRVGAERERVVHGAEVRAIVAALYAMYAAHLREVDMDPLWRHLERLPDGDTPVALRPPTR